MVPSSSDEEEYDDDDDDEDDKENDDSEDISTVDGIIIEKLSSTDALPSSSRSQDATLNKDMMKRWVVIESTRVGSVI